MALPVSLSPAEVPSASAVPDSLATLANTGMVVATWASVPAMDRANVHPPNASVPAWLDTRELIALSRCPPSARPTAPVVASVSQIPRAGLAVSVMRVTPVMTAAASSQGCVRASAVAKVAVICRYTLANVLERSVRLVTCQLTFVAGVSTENVSERNVTVSKDIRDLDVTSTLAQVTLVHS